MLSRFNLQVVGLRGHHIYTSGVDHIEDYAVGVMGSIRTCWRRSVGKTGLRKLLKVTLRGRFAKIWNGIFILSNSTEEEKKKDLEFKPSDLTLTGKEIACPFDPTTDLFK
jgi:hypothetical protein